MSMLAKIKPITINVVPSIASPLKVDLKARSPISAFFRALHDQDIYLRYIIKKIKTSPSSDLIKSRYLNEAYALSLTSKINTYETFLKDLVGSTLNNFPFLINDNALKREVKVKDVLAEFNSLQGRKIMFPSGSLIVSNMVLQNPDIAAEVYRDIFSNFPLYPDEVVRKTMRDIFQIRHTISHNNKFLTPADCQKFTIFKVSPKQQVDINADFLDNCSQYVLKVSRDINLRLKDHIFAKYFVDIAKKDFRRDKRLYTKLFHLFYECRIKESFPVITSAHYRSDLAKYIK